MAPRSLAVVQHLKLEAAELVPGSRVQRLGLDGINVQPSSAADPATGLLGRGLGMDGIDGQRVQGARLLRFFDRRLRVVPVDRGVCLVNTFCRQPGSG